MSKTMTVYIPTTGDSSSQAQSKVVTIANLKSVDGLTVNTGTVNHTVSGNNITINVNGGAVVRQTSSSPSINASSSLTSSSNSFPSTVSYNDGTYSGTLSKNGLSYVLSGSYTPGDSKLATATSSVVLTQPWIYDVVSGSYTPSDSKFVISNGITVNVTWSWGWDSDQGWLPLNGIGYTTSNAPSSINYNVGGYVNTTLGAPPGTVSVNFGTRPTLINQTPGSFGQVRTQTVTNGGVAAYSGTATKPAVDTRVYGWKTNGLQTNNANSTYSYNSGGYTGTLNQSNPFITNAIQPSIPTDTVSPGTIRNTTGSATANYNGTVTSGSIDTRVWKQDYSGTAYGSTTYTSYYAYVVTLTYTDSVKLGTVNYKTSSGIVSLPVYDLTMADPILRVKLPNAIGCFELVPIGDARASNVRIQTQRGIRAIAKS